MTKFFKKWLFWLLLIAPAPNLVWAADEEFCTDYVLVSIAQYWKSIDADCGFSGLRWNSDYDGQFEWCRSAHQWVAENEAATRQRLLEECLAEQASRQQPVVNEDQAITPQSSAGVGAKREAAALADTERLLQAVADDNLEQVMSLQEQGADMNFLITDRELMRKFDMAYTMGEGIEVRGEDNALQLSGNAVLGKVQADAAVSESLLSYAVSKGLVKVGLWLIEQQGDATKSVQRAELKRKLLGNALIGVARQQNAYTTGELMALGAAVDYELDDNFGTPLHFAVINGDTALVKTLLANGANAKYSTNGGPNMLNLALDKPAILHLLLSHGADPDSNGETVGGENLPLFAAINSGNFQAVELLVQNGADTGYADVETPYPLIQAVRMQDLDMVNLLLKYGANPNLVYNGGSPGACSDSEENITALSEAIKAGADNIIKVLMLKGAQTSEQICGQGL